MLVRGCLIPRRLNYGEESGERPATFSSDISCTPRGGRIPREGRSTILQARAQWPTLLRTEIKKYNSKNASAFKTMYGFEAARARPTTSIVSRLMVPVGHLQAPALCPFWSLLPVGLVQYYSERGSRPVGKIRQPITVLTWLDCFEASNQVVR